MSVRILLVDDEEKFVEMLSQRLEARGFSVGTALSGDQAMATIRDRDYDVVILDVQMPGKSGIETLREIKELRPLTEVIMLTGNATTATAIEGMKIGAYDYLMKPAETEDLVKKINKANRRKTDQEERIRQAEVDRIIKARGW
jgi:DNA-binding response OmpR family regulator